jgi:citrate lyase subunit beta / citryl-CoA lyase
MPLARSFLYVPANRDKFLEKAIGLPSHAFIFDLEGSVPAAEKENARAGVRAYAPKIADNRVWVRVNGLDTDLAEADLDAVVGSKASPACFCRRSRPAPRCCAGTA